MYLDPMATLGGCISAMRGLMSGVSPGVGDGLLSMKFSGLLMLEQGDEEIVMSPEDTLSKSMLSPSGTGDEAGEMMSTSPGLDGRFAFIRFAFLSLLQLRVLQVCLCPLLRLLLRLWVLCLWLLPLLSLLLLRLRGFRSVGLSSLLLLRLRVLRVLCLRSLLLLLLRLRVFSLRSSLLLLLQLRVLRVFCLRSLLLLLLRLWVLRFMCARSLLLFLLLLRVACPCSLSLHLWRCAESLCVPVVGSDRYLAFSRAEVMVVNLGSLLSDCREPR